MSNETDSETGGEEDGNGSTKSVKTRWKYTNDLVASALLISLPIFASAAGYGFIDIESVSLLVLMGYITIVGIASVWMFGIDAAAEWKKIKEGFPDGG